MKSRTNLCESRGRGRARAATIAAEAQRARVAAGDTACTDGALARRWKLASDRGVAKLFDPESGAALTLGDVIDMPRELARETLVRALAALEEGDGPAPDVTLGDLAIRLGVIAEGIARDRADDGVVNDHARHRDNFAAASRVAVRGYIAADRRTRGGQ